ncbi:MAG: hypothetical protein OEZ37_08685 [Gemmatimonadota bacterium]|nr:hypothetical protein [Gemmatimonadota bacterium]
MTGILAALAVDGWAESRRERELERELIQSFILDLRADSTDFDVLPVRAVARAVAAEILLANLAPDFHSRRGLYPDLAHAEGRDSTFAFPLPDSLAGDVTVPASDSELTRAFYIVAVPSDMDVARGAYRAFTDGGEQRLVRNRELRRRIHDYHYQVESWQQFDPRMVGAIAEVRRRAVELGIAVGYTEGSVLRTRLQGREAEPLLAAIVDVQDGSSVQAWGARHLQALATDLLRALYAELEGS